MPFYLVHVNPEIPLDEKLFTEIATTIDHVSDKYSKLWNNYTWLIESRLPALKIGQSIKARLPKDTDYLIVAEIFHENTAMCGPLDERFKQFFWPRMLCPDNSQQ